MALFNMAMAASQVAAAVDCGLEHEELAEEAGQGRDAGQAEHEDGHGQRRAGPTIGDACGAVVQRVVFAGLFQRDHNGEGADVHEGVGEEIEECSVCARDWCRA